MKKLNITIIGRRWFEKTNGNTYHSVEVYAEGELLERVPFAYGYGEGYDQTAAGIVKKHYPKQWAAAEKQAGYSLPYGSSLKRYGGHNVITSCTDVQRKKDL